LADYQAGQVNNTVLYEGGHLVSVLVDPTQNPNVPMGTIYGVPNQVTLTVYPIVDNPTGAVNTSPPLSASSVTTQTNAAPCPANGLWWNSIATEQDSEPVGEIHTWDDMTGTFTYTKNASSHFGWGYAYGNGWVAGGGTVTTSDTNAFSAGPITLGARTAKQMTAAINWSKDNGYDECGRATGQQRIVATGWSGELWVGADVSGNDGPDKYYQQPDTHHARIWPGTSDAKNSGKGFQYTYQVQAFGVNVLSSETDYGSNVENTWAAGTQNVTHSLFSYGAAPADVNSQIVFASTEPPWDPGVGSWGPAGPLYAFW
jgi:hypothetical protein